MCIRDSDGMGKCAYIVEIEECTADLELNKSVTPTTAQIGDQVVYTIEVENKGPAVGTNVTVDDILHLELDYVSHATPDGSYSNVSGVWAIPSLGVGQTATLNITTTINTAGTNIINTAEITGADQPDLDSETNNDDGDQSEDDEDSALLVSIPTANLGNFVWHDADQDGAQDSGEVPIPAVIVELFDANTGTLLGTQVTDSTGLYLFTDLPLGDYYLTFNICLLYTSPSPRDRTRSRMPSSA